MSRCGTTASTYLQLRTISAICVWNHGLFAFIFDKFINGYADNEFIYHAFGVSEKVEVADMK